MKTFSNIGRSVTTRQHTVSKTVKSNDDALSIIVDDLSSLPMNKISGTSWFVMCPFHHEVNNPSCSVNIDVSSVVPLGYFRCFGCGHTGPWNVLASALNLTIIEKWKLNRQVTSTLTDEAAIILSTIEAIESREHGNNYIKESTSMSYNMEKTLKAMKVRLTAPWPKYKEWRGYDGMFLKKIGARMVLDEKRHNSKHKPDYSENTDYISSCDALFPVYINDILHGIVKGITDPVKGGKSYITSPGEWVKNHGLLFYDYAKHLINTRHIHTLFVVEGPRDAMRFLSQGYPSIPVLGAKSMSERKLRYLCLLNIKNLVIIPDNDNGGDELKRDFENIVYAFESYSCLPFDVTYIDLPKNGKKLDPHSISQSMINKITGMFC